MHLPRSAAVAPRLEVLASAGSTNDELRRRVQHEPEEWPDGSVLVTDDQTAGRGRLGRSWTAPAGGSIAISLLVRADLPPTAIGWLPLLAGLAMTRALRDLGVPAALKWPNDVLVRGRKLCGILAELLPGADGLIVGAGVNLTLTEEELPVPTATSLAMEGVEPDPDAVLAGYLSAFRTELDALAAAGGSAERSGLRAAVLGVCDTVGRAVRVELPSAMPLQGVATGIDETGRLLVLPGDTPHSGDSAGNAVPVSAGDVTHLRY